MSLLVPTRLRGNGWDLGHRHLQSPKIPQQRRTTEFIVETRSPDGRLRIFQRRAARWRAGIGVMGAIIQDRDNQTRWISPFGRETTVRWNFGCGSGSSIYPYEGFVAYNSHGKRGDFGRANKIL
uniref:Uncharacterized protein n=1 Tax=Candidatus Kentrum sp. SD TaxID=2126332 RepID=A0A451BMU1_9GAMM|nr:MAG: hypothetical protein BECKSD772D_GA0070982_10567 [Candidatus Kentron sp. SD]